MMILPRSNPLYEQIPVQKVNLPDAFARLGSGGFTGYLGFGSSRSEGFFLFIKGSMISVLMLEGDKRRIGFEAISALFEHAIADGGHVDVYRMTPDVVMCCHALLHGEVLLPSQEVRTVEIKGVLAKMKVQALNGTVHFSTADRSALIFYKDGLPLGFYHDGAKEIETSPAESQRVAALPGATIEIRSSATAEVLMHHNLLETLNIDRLWAASRSRISSSAISTQEEPPPAKRQDTEERAAFVAEIAEDLREIASAYLSRHGSIIVEQLIEEAGGPECLLDSDKTAAFLNAVTDKAKSIDPEARIDEMIDLMKSEIAGRLSV